MKSYVTSLSTESYLPGVFALNEALRRVKSSHPLLVLLSPALATGVAESLQQAGMAVKTIPASVPVPADLQAVAGHWGHTFDKLHVFGLTEFEKLVYVDSDMIVLANIDELFDKPHMSAVAAGRLLNPDWNRLNSGLMTIVPERGLPEKIAMTLERARSDQARAGNVAIGDQDLINAYYPAWGASPGLHLDQGYNIFQCHLDSYIDEHGYRLPGSSHRGGPEAKIVHFIGPHKPWMKGASIRHYLNVLKKRNSIPWESRMFAVYKKLIRECRLPVAAT
jgi:glycogenin glucosyltransferase